MADVNRTLSRLRLQVAPVVFAFMAANTGCTDVGDNSNASGEAGAENFDAASSGLDGSTNPESDGTTVPDGAVGSDDGPVPVNDGSSSGTPDAGPGAGTGEESGVSPLVDAGNQAATDSSVADAAEASAPEGGSLDTGSPESGSPDASISDTGSRDAAIHEGGDAMLAEASADATVQDATLADAMGQDAAFDSSQAEAGALVPCTAAGQANCVSCPNTANGVCTPTEAVFIELDIHAGAVTAPGPDTNMNGCYQCLVGTPCIDTARYHTLECGDLTGNFLNGSGATVVAADACLATLECEMGPAGDQCAVPAVHPEGLTYCYCGSGGGAPTDCASKGSAVNGACLAQNVAGLKYASKDAHDITINFTDVTQPSGLANTIIGCALNNCTMCTP